jgi:flagellar protein FlaG
MEILQSTAKMQQSQMSTVKVAQSQQAQSVQDIQKSQIHQENLAQKETENQTGNVGSQEKMDKLIDKLNRSLDPFSTSLRFGFDNTSDDFYVSVIDTQRNQVLRRFPLEQAELILPKMQEVTGLLFDHKG